MKKRKKNPNEVIISKIKILLEETVQLIINEDSKKGKAFIYGILKFVDGLGMFNVQYYKPKHRYMANSYFNITDIISIENKKIYIKCNWKNMEKNLGYKIQLGKPSTVRLDGHTSMSGLLRCNENYYFISDTDGQFFVSFKPNAILDARNNIIWVQL